ncbi:MULTISPECIES: group-specific protein [Peribacillus]|uniref:group-specific protein n=1 Tax=Peribacillus TaxID=2675229 RepID=UPI0019139C91|nr:MULTISPECIES: group-specific protein [unclassified Peribacillus]MBK5444638.1 group-specific protein [Peribacillus sp. TH24]MBK5460656.1 group-specific protein [Peribacillus sp. TH27]MBK5482440.1 group-specific protein [Peribacillus sp. TH16]MBK5498804.1 group-specific protein [Peribacillus sp. TH14]
MGTCNLNHSQQDVRLKLESQMRFLPKDLGKKLGRFLENENSQETLNELFHLLKKYDLASKEEQDARNEKLNHFMR